MGSVKYQEITVAIQGCPRGFTGYQEVLGPTQGATGASRESHVRFSVPQGR